jgi:hypothetical protein
MPSEKRKNNPYSGIAEKVEQIMACFLEGRLSGSSRGSGPEWQ